MWKEMNDPGTSCYSNGATIVTSGTVSQAHFLSEENKLQNERRFISQDLK